MGADNSCYNIVNHIVNSLKKEGLESKIVENIISQGHMIGNHTWSHRLLLAVNKKILKQEIYDFDQYFKSNFNYSMKFFRPPWGIITKKARNIIEKQYGYKIFTWHQDSLDYLLPFSRNIHKIVTPKF